MYKTLQVDGADSSVAHSYNAVTRFLPTGLTWRQVLVWVPVICFVMEFMLAIYFFNNHKFSDRKLYNEHV